MSWAKTFLIASHEFLTRIKSPVFYILILNPFVGYMLIGLLFGLMFAGASENLELPVGLMDHSGLLSMLPSKEKGDENFLIYSSMEEAQAALRDRRVRALVEIPPDYLESGQIIIWVYGSSSWPTTVLVFNQTESFLRKTIVQNRLDSRTARRVIEPIDGLRIIIADQVGELGDLDLQGGIFGRARAQVQQIVRFLIQTGARYIILVSLFLSNISISITYSYQDISRDRANRMGELMLSTVSATEWFAGKILGVVLIMLTQTLIQMTLVLAIWGGISWQLLGDLTLLSPREVGLVLVYYVLSMLFYVSASMLAIVVHPKVTPVLLGILQLLNLINAAVVVAPSSRIAIFMSFFPLTAPGTMLVRVLLKAAPWRDVVISLGVLGVCSMLAILAGSAVASRVLIPGMPAFSISRPRQRR
jgi:ABC-2 type transport system permease protein